MQISTIFLSVLNMSLTGAFVIAAILLARFPLKNAPKIISHCLWAVAGFRLTVPFTLEGLFSLIPFRAQPIPQEILVPADISTMIAPTLQNAIAVAADLPYYLSPRLHLGVTEETYTIAETAVLPGYANVHVHYDLFPFLINFGAYVWLAGAAVLLAYGIVSYFALKWRLRNAERLSQNIFEAENISTPFVLGFLPAKIYLPRGLSADERGYVVLHEQTHIRRGDHIVKFAAYAILCLHWFNPAVWAAFSFLGKDIEMSCDERVLRELGSDVKKPYSLSLLSFAAGRFFAGSPIAFGEHGTEERVKNILKFKTRSRVFVASVVILTVIFGAGFLFSRSENAAEPPELSEFVALVAGVEREAGQQINETLVNATIHRAAISPERVAEMLRFGYEPEHDVSIVTFAPEANISLYLEQTPIDLRGRNIYPVRVGNHDQVYLPFEPVFDALGIEYTWNESISRFDIPLAEVPYGMRVDFPFSLRRNASGFYFRSEQFNRLIERELYENMGYVSHQPWVPLIYHDLEKVVIVSHERIGYPHYAGKFWAEFIQTRRADYPLTEAPQVVFHSFEDLSTHPLMPWNETESVINFQTGAPFLVQTELADYVMLPALEMLEIMGLDFAENDDGILLAVNNRTISHHATGAGWVEMIIMPRNDFQISDGVPLFPPEEKIWTRGHIHEVPPALVDGVLYISHTDLSRVVTHYYSGERFFSISSLDLRREYLVFTAMSRHALSAVPTGWIDTVGDPIFETTEHGKVIRHDTGDQPLPADTVYIVAFEFTLRATPENPALILLPNGENPHESTLEPWTDTGVVDLHSYRAEFEIFAYEPIEFLDVIIADPGYIAPAGMWITARPVEFQTAEYTGE